jgi:hypothetical protein
MKILSLLIIVFLIIPLFSYSQNPCPPTINEQGWTVVDISYEPLPSEFWGHVNIKHREINGKFEVKVDWNTLHNFGNYGISDEEFKQMMYKAIIVQVTGGGYNCNFTGTKQIVFYEESNCTITKNCYLKVSMESEVFCSDIGWPGPNPDIFNFQSQKYLKISANEICGVQCCELNFIVECIPKASGAGTYVHIVNKYRSPVPGSECNSSNSTDCLTGDPEPCTSTCY